MRQPVSISRRLTSQKIFFADFMYQRIYEGALYSKHLLECRGIPGKETEISA
jgi:hypothetical protein